MRIRPVVGFWCSKTNSCQMSQDAMQTLAISSALGPDGLVAFVETDDLDVPYVIVKRLREGMR